ncbi:MAG: iron uptake transporter permease EfeU [Micropruina sp.]
MLGNLLIGLREGLEAGLVVSILAAYVVKTDRRHLLPQLWQGVLTAIGISLTFGALLTFGPKGLTFEAQELIGGGLSIIAVGFVTWMIFWMASAGKRLAGELRGLIDGADGTRWSIGVIALLAVGREGLETALFIWAATQAAARSADSTVDPLFGALVGLLLAAALTYAIYRGVVRINLSRFFTITGALLILVAAGVLAYGTHDLQEARFLPGLNTLAYDVSAWIGPSSLLGTMLKGIFNFSPAASVLEVSAWALYVVIIGFFFARVVAPQASSTSPARPLTSVGVRS